MARATMYFPPDFLWGTATSSHQVEGNNENNDWWAWEQEEGRILNGDKSGVACDWWANAERDFDHAAALHTNAHRLSLEWSRIEPEPSVFNAAALDRYRAMLQGLHDRGIEPMVTLHHFTNPRWLGEKGDFDSDLMVDYFQRYTAQVVDKLGDLIPKWVTINEPLIYLFFRYLGNEFPAPRQKGWGAARRAIHTMLKCHAAAYHTIKESYPESLIGVAAHIRPIQPPADGGRLDHYWARQMDWLFNDMWLEAMRDGRIRGILGRGTIKGLAGTYDYLGLNYYSRSLIRFPRTQPEPCPDGAEMSDMNFMENYPAGMFHSIKRLLRYQKPIYITENGLPDKEDRLRPAYLIAHLREIWRAISFNFPVMGYYHWSLVDNFEWERGWSQRFGLIGLDLGTQERQWRPSAHLYAQICRDYALSSDLTEQYAPTLLPVLFPGNS